MCIRDRRFWSQARSHSRYSLSNPSIPAKSGVEGWLLPILMASLARRKFDVIDPSAPMAASLELRSVSEVFTLRTLGAAVSFSTKAWKVFCLLYTSDAADEEDSVDLGGR